MKYRTRTEWLDAVQWKGGLEATESPIWLQTAVAAKRIVVIDGTAVVSTQAARPEMVTTGGYITCGKAGHLAVYSQLEFEVLYEPAPAERARQCKAYPMTSARRRRGAILQAVGYLQLCDRRLRDCHHERGGHDVAILETPDWVQELQDVIDLWPAEEAQTADTQTFEKHDGKIKDETTTGAAEQGQPDHVQG